MQCDFSKSQLKNIGQKLRHGICLSDFEESLLAQFRMGHRNIIEAFRQSHKSILEKAKWRDRGIFFASRLKKRNTLITKLSNRHTQMDLTRMHDIAGCRVVFLCLADLMRYRNRFMRQISDANHYARLDGSERYDYIQHPRETGYRGIHDVYEENAGEPIRAKIEVQYRTITQHAWATALEIWDQAHGGGAKFGAEQSGVQRLFCLYAELLWRYSDCKDDALRNTLDISNENLYRCIRDGERKFGVLKYLAGLQKIDAKVMAQGEDILLHRIVPPEKEGGNGLVARQMEWDVIQEKLFALELNNSDDLVFVQAKPKVLKRAYNNYFDDASGFVRKVRRAMTVLSESRRFLWFRQPLDPVFRVQE